MHHKHGTGGTVLIVLLLLSSSLIVFSQNAQAAAGPGSSATTFYLHDDQHGFGHPGKRYDWANTSLPYNPLNPYFISSSYQGILLNNSMPYNSFRWIVSPSLGAPVALNGTVSVQLYLTPSNTSTGIPVNLSVTLQNLTVTSSGVSIKSIAHNYTGGIFLTPNELVNVTMKISTPYLLSANSSIVLNVTRNDSNSLTSVYVEFDYNSTPSNFRVSVTPRISSAVVSAAGIIYDNQSFPVLASVTDSLGHQDIAHVMLSAVNTSGVQVVSGIMMTETTYGRYVSNFSADIGPLHYGKYVIETIAGTVSNLSGGNELFYQNYSVTVLPSLSSFTVSSPAGATAGVPFAVNATAVADSGLNMTAFNGTADIQLIRSNGTVLSPALYSPHSALFASGFSRFSVNVTSAGNFSGACQH